MNLRSFSEKTLKIWGWFLTIPIIISLVVTWIIGLPDAITELKESLVDLFKKEEKKIAKSKTINDRPKERPKKTTKLEEPENTPAEY